MLEAKDVLAFSEWKEGLHVTSPHRTVCRRGFLAHTTRVLEVGRALRTRYGHDVVFCCDGPYARLLHPAGFPVRPVYSVDREETLRLARRAGACDLRWWQKSPKTRCDRTSKPSTIDAGSGGR